MIFLTNFHIEKFRKPFGSLRSVLSFHVTTTSHLMIVKIRAALKHRVREPEPGPTCQRIQLTQQRTPNPSSPLLSLPPTLLSPAAAAAARSPGWLSSPAHTSASSGASPSKP